MRGSLHWTSGTLRSDQTAALPFQLKRETCTTDHRSSEIFIGHLIDFSRQKAINQNGMGLITVTTLLGRWPTRLSVSKE